jgi:gas vesicle protein
MTNTNENSSSTQNFFSGFLLGAAIAGAGFYLTMTKSGRKIAREVLKRTEELGEEGNLLFEDLSNSPLAQKVKKHSGKKIEGIIDKLKQEVKSVKKS